MKSYSNWLFFIALIFIITIIWLTYPQWIIYTLSFSVGTSQQNLGAFGDSFGALNALFSGFAFTGVILSIFLQSKEIRQARKEVKAQLAQFIHQTNALNKQVFENTFFQLIQMHNEIVQSIAIEYPSDSTEKLLTLSGRSAFPHLYRNFKEGLLKEVSEKNQIDNNKYNQIFLEYNDQQLGHYFRNIYQIMRYIDESEITDKKFYTNLLRAQLSNYELALLFYNCLNEPYTDKFKSLVEKYEFFEHLPRLDILNNEIKIYDISAFGTSNKAFIAIHQQS